MPADLSDAEIHLLDTGHFALEEEGAASADLVLSFLDRHAEKELSR